MNVREIELPGIGKKFEVITKSKDKIVVIIHDDGRRDIYYFDQDNFEEAIANTSFDDAEARQIAAIIGGMTYAPKALETIEMAFDDLVIEWFKVQNGAEAAQQTIGQLNIRQSYEVNVVAIIKQKNYKEIHTPGPETLLEEGDTVIVSGQRKQVKMFVKEVLTRRDG
ncbi:cation:proton antiporter regulatory subunit [Paenibacillus allorhizosphaerae]|uniref:K(+)/H(+) antiporter subunit KhtT n=1 Tax=Paenibacillus allorhizosphaerae TaxID=2849866 RepID=A0ABM8VTM5_9BACL|nr:cation:proton antiporter regulatory subunit [Paenibacillus allorhizosphaerae]CAG7657612.1 K(+)/H(+) antiporter subunit KhtT [Paenibacillus allorhizosphaerae]